MPEFCATESTVLDGAATAPEPDKSYLSSTNSACLPSDVDVLHRPRPILDELKPQLRAPAH